MLVWHTLDTPPADCACAVSALCCYSGTLHLYPGTPSGSNYARTKIASCSRWVPASGAVKYSLVDSAANVSSSSAKPVVKVRSGCKGKSSANLQFQHLA
jgi:hypothetical protein